MTQVCNHEEAVVALVSQGKLGASLADHLKECASCRAAASMTCLLIEHNSCFQATEEPGHLMDIIWIMAVYENRTKQKIIHKLGVAVGLLLGALMFYLICSFYSLCSVGLAATDFFLSNAIPIVGSLALLTMLLVFIFRGDCAKETGSYC